MVDQRHFRQSRGIVHLGDATFLVIYLVGHVGHRSDHLHIEFTAKTLLYDLHMEQTEETAAESETERHRRLRLECEGGIVELQFFQRRSQVLEVFRLDGIDAGKHHRFYLLEPFDGGSGASHMGYGIAYFHLP